MKTAEHSIYAFVRNAWLLLAFQMIAATAALAVTAWATLKVRPLLLEKERLEADIKTGQTRLEELKSTEASTRIEMAELDKKLGTLRTELKGARDATKVLSEAIEAFHNKQYGSAIASYDEALRLDPGDPYILNLKSYSQFKAGDSDGAIRSVTESLSMDPSYEWGYFDLARYQCARGSPEAALGTISKAIESRGKSIRQATGFFLKDGEFRRLCAPIVAELRKLAE